MAKKTDAGMLASTLPDGWVFDISNYKDAAVEQPDREPHTLICRRVGGKPVTVRFHRRIAQWSLELEVDIALEAEPDDFVSYYRGLDVDDAIIDFWEKLTAKRVTSYAAKRDRVFKEVQQMFGC